MDGYTISDAAQRTGLAASTLRYYEKSNLLTPGRTPTGYRSYTDDDLDTLRFISRAKTFGLTLEEIADLITLLAEGDCEPVQSRLQDLIRVKVAAAEDQVAELVAFTAELQRVAGMLADHHPEGSCGADCGCVTEPAAAGTAVPLIDKPPAGGDQPIVCTLVPGQIDGRLDDWKATLARAEQREDIPGGARLRFARDVDPVAIAALAAAEQQCCGFFTFAIGISPDAVTLDITGPDDARAVIDTLTAAT